MNEERLLETPLAAEHVALGAKMVPFAGWNMPVQYKDGILAEHRHTREAVSLFDICHMGELRLKGPGAACALDSALARAVEDQKVGVCRYNFLLNERGGVIDDLIVYRMGKEDFFIVVNAARIEADFAALKARMPDGIALTNESDNIAKLDLQGPLATRVLQALSIYDLPKYYHWNFIRIDSLDCLISRTGYTGELGYELYFDARKAKEIWNLLLGFDQVKPAGLGARDTLRLEMAYPLYGHEMDEETTPLEAGFGAMLKLDASNRSFVGSEALRSVPPKKRLVGLVFDGRRAAQAGSPLLLDGREVGRITSGTFAPSLNRAIALAYVNAGTEFGAESDFTVELHRATAHARLAETPFWKKGTVR